MTVMDAAQDGKRLLRRWLFSFFGVMLIANGFFLWFALSTHTGEQSRNAYEEGRLYNDIIAADTRLDELGWQMNVSVSDQQLRVTFVDGMSQPLDGQVVWAQLFRPSNAREDTQLNLVSENVGEFTANVGELSHGHWQVRVRILANEETMEMRRDIMVD